MKLADSDYVCIMNNDTIATEGWLSGLISVMETHADIGLLNPSSNTSGQFPDKGESVYSYAAQLKKYIGEIQELSVCRGFCMVIRKEVIEKVGVFDEIYDLGYFEETDYSKKSISKGFKIARAKGSYVYYKENVSFKEVERSEELFKKNESIFFERWGHPVRVAYFVDKQGSGNNINEIAVGIARDGHQIIIFLKNGIDWPVGIDHFDIRRVDVNPLLFGMISTYKILKRKRKKRLDVILTDNLLFGKFLEVIKIFHGADVVIKPRKEDLVGLLNEKSKN